MSDVTSEAGQYLGRPIPRIEDVRFITGRGQYVDDISLPGMLEAAILRSPHAHALVKRIDYSRAAALPGVHGIITGSDVAAAIEPERGSCSPNGGSCYFIAVDRSRYAGEPVAVIAADDRYIAEDAAELIEVDYEPLPVVMDPERAGDPDQTVLHPDAPGGNEVSSTVSDFGDVDAAFAHADVTLRERFVVSRHSATPIEGLAAIASWDALSGQTSMWVNLGNMARYSAAARALRLDNADLRLIVPDVGGSFGAKAWVHQRAVLLAVLSRKVDRPVKWTEDRLEHLQANHHATSRIAYAEVAARRDGTILGLKLRIIDDQGAYVCLNEPLGPTIMLSNGVVGPYAVKNVRIEASCVLTNKAPVASMRGYGRVQQYFVLERLIDVLARELEMDPAELRLRNFIPADAYPYITPSKVVYDSGDFAALMQRARGLLDYDKVRAEQAAARQAGRLLGVGFAAAVEGGGANYSRLGSVAGRPLESNMATEVATIQLGPDGRLSAQVPTIAQGQGHETTIAQIVADRFGVDPASVRVTVQFDSATMPYTAMSGTFSSRFSSAGAPATYEAAGKLRVQLAQLAAQLLEASPDDIEFTHGRVQVVGTSGRSLSLRELATQGYSAPESFGLGPDVGLQATYRWNWPLASVEGKLVSAPYTMNTYATLVHAALVEVDPSSGIVDVKKYVAVEDCGRLLNPTIVRGMAMGGIVHGLGWSLTEKLAYDEQGQLLTASFMDYLPPRFTDIPELKLEHVEFPTPFGPLGAKGMGEGGSIPVPACIANAVEDAIGHTGARIRDSHVPPETVLEVLDTRIPHPEGDRRC